MTPREPLSDAVHRVLADAIQRSNPALGHTFSDLFTDRADLPLREFRVPVSLPRNRTSVESVPSFGVTITDVDLLTPDEEVAGPDADRIVAAVQDLLAGLEWAMLTGVDVPMRQHTFLVSPEAPVPFAEAASPRPTTFYAVTVNEPPKPFERIGQLAGLACRNSSRHDGSIPS